MKKYYFLIVGFLFFGLASSQIVNIPDPIFKARLLNQSTTYTTAKNSLGQNIIINSNNNNEIELSEALQVFELGILGTNPSNQVVSIEGINSFVNLTTFTCNQNRIVEIDITGLTNLKLFDCSSNTTITSLNLNGLVNLETIYCQSSPIGSLDVSTLTNLKYLNCQTNELTSLNLSSNKKLQTLLCGVNFLTSLDLSELPALSSVGFDFNPLESIFLKNGKTEVLYDFSGVPTLKYICADEVDLINIQSKLNQYGYTNCVLNSYCSFTPGGTFYSIYGINKFDGNNDGCDQFDFSLNNLKYTITNGVTSGTILSNISGNYFVPVQLGTYTITPLLENPTYLNVSPLSANISFSETSIPINQNFCFTSNGTHNDLEIIIIPVNISRPGFDSNYKIVYKNKGTQIQSGTLSFSFNDSVLDFIVSNPSTANQSLNSLAWNFTNLQPFETREISLTLNLNSPAETPPVNAGFVLNYIATISGAPDETPLDNISTLNQTVVNSYDPNDKTCLEGVTITPSQVGKEVHYMIRFENTGTAKAQNIVVKDMIDTTKFDVNSLIPISGSHPFVTRITNTSKVEFIFENIQLPFDDANNDGYVAFKIKTKPTLVLGNTFSNTASIFFDYNFPIITNTATTTVSDVLANQDFEFSNYISISPNPAKETLNVNTKDIEVSSISIYNTLGQLVQVIPNAKEIKAIDVSTLKTGNYFIKIISDKGSSSSKFIKE